jgi:hypothetical protein
MNSGEAGGGLSGLGARLATPGVPLVAEGGPERFDLVVVVVVTGLLTLIGLGAGLDRVVPTGPPTRGTPDPTTVGAAPTTAGRPGAAAGGAITLLLGPTTAHGPLTAG